jgi:hypothetical protein
MKSTKFLKTNQMMTHTNIVKFELLSLVVYYLVVKLLLLGLVINIISIIKSDRFNEKLLFLDRVCGRSQVMI